MEWSKNNSVVNKVMFMPPPMSINDIEIVNDIFYIPGETYDYMCKLYLATGKFFNKYTDKTIPARPTIIFCHGNACNILHHSEFAIRLSSITDCNVLLMEYPGYEPFSGVSTSEKNCSTAICKVINFLNYELCIPLDNIVMIGQSIGTGVAVVGAAYAGKVGGLVLISPYLSIKDLANDISGYMSNSILNRFVTKDGIKNIHDTNILIIHGVKDTVIPVGHGKRLAKIAKDNGMNVITHFPAEATHNTFNYHTDIYTKVKLITDQIVIPDIKYYNVEAIHNNPTPNTKKNSEIINMLSTSTAISNQIN